MKKKLVYITNEWIYDTDLTVLRNLTDEYELYWFEFTSFTNPRVKREVFEQYAESNNIHLELIDAKDKYLSPKRINTFIKLAKIINKIQPDIVVKVEQDAYWMIVSKLLINCPIVYCIHDAEVHSGTHNRWLRQLFTDSTICLNRNFIVFSKAQKNLLESKYKNKNVALINMSVKDFGVALHDRSSIKEGVKLLFFGRIEYHKGLDLLIEALEKLYSTGVENVRLSVLGRGSLWRKCEAMIKDTSRYNLQIRFIEDEEIPNAFASHHFLALPYRDTTQSGPLMIAANYGLPLFAYSHQSFTEVYCESSALLYKNIDDGLKALAEMTEADYSNIEHGASLLKEKYSEKNIARKYIEYFNEIIR